MAENENSFVLVENRQAIDLVPTWEPQLWWFVVAAGVIVLLILLAFYVRRKKVIYDPRKSEHEAYLKAVEIFRKMEPAGGRAAAVRVSLTLRGYLAESLGEPALFQTHEEFIGRHDALVNLPEEMRTATSDFFEELSAMKYAPEEVGGEFSGDLKVRGTELLERIHAA